jgi:hypothetical protein
MRVDEESAPLERLYARLTTALQSRRSEPWSAPVTVAEIYQELVPYRVVREEAGFAMNADYEHALLRLLSGEGDWARLEPPTARDVIERELRSANPNVTIYREYAACDVWIKPPQTRLHATEPAAPPAQEDDDELDELELLDEDVEETTPSTFALYEVEPPPPSAMPPHPAPGAAAERPASAPADRKAAASGDEAQGYHCAFCDSRLPSGRKVRFCPFCGGDQTTVPCGTCSEPLETAWRFCAACGAAAPIP